jgi:hypothetical protein
MEHKDDKAKIDGILKLAKDKFKFASFIILSGIGGNLMSAVVRT